MSEASSALIGPAANPVSDPSPVGLRLTSRLSHEPPPVTAQLGWRYMKYDFKKNGFTDTNALNGPFIQAGVNFY